LEKKIVLFWLCLASCFFTGCQTYYYANEEFNSAYQRGDYAYCRNWLKKHKPKARSKDKFLYFTNSGTISFLMDQEDSSNQFFEKSYLLAEDFQQKAGENVAAMLTNPKRITYTGERHEQYLIHYFKALNLLKLRQFETALIEVRRLIRKMNVLEDQNKKNYRSDGFLLWMIGTIFEAAGEENNAYIYYKKSQEAYEKNFGSLVQAPIPQQLKEDLVRTAYQSNFDAEGRYFETKLGVSHKPLKPGEGTALLIWHKGLGPVKAENRIVFQLVKGAGGQVFFTNEEWGLNFPFFLPPGEAYNPNRFDNLKIITMAWPKYTNRNFFYKNLNVGIDGRNFAFQRASSIEKIAAADLKDRMLKEMALSISRVAIKQAVQYLATAATEEAVKNGKGDKDKKASQADLAGSLVNLAFTIANTATEVADTRNWQTLPAEIEILKIPLPEGKHTLQLGTRSQNSGSGNQKIELDIRAGQTTVYTIQTF
jgi:hypothetical protein